jgi:hypothetical protein
VSRASALPQPVVACFAFAGKILPALSAQIFDQDRVFQSEQAASSQRAQQQRVLPA